MAAAVVTGAGSGGKAGKAGKAGKTGKVAGSSVTGAGVDSARGVASAREGILRCGGPWNNNK
jgi:hypothetical protein